MNAVQTSTIMIDAGIHNKNGFIVEMILPNFVSTVNPKRNPQVKVMIVNVDPLSGTFSGSIPPYVKLLDSNAVVV